jgi:hypothetical protein
MQITSIIENLLALQNCRIRIFILRFQVLEYEDGWLSSGLLRSEIALMMEAASTSETSVNFYQTSRRNNPEHNHFQGSS